VETEEDGGADDEGDDEAEAVRMDREVERPRDSLATVATVRTVRVGGRIVVYALQQDRAENQMDD
jgi:hypothetical protein